MIDEALRIALALFANERCDADYRTLWRDEPAGNLSASNVRRYVAMLIRARKLGGFHQVFFVTHSDNAADAADDKLKVRNGTVAVGSRRRNP